MRRSMSFDTLFLERPDMVHLSHSAIVLHVTTLLFLARTETDTAPPHVVVHMLRRTRTKRKHVEELLDANVWWANDDGTYTLGNHHKPRGAGRPPIPFRVRYAVYERDNGQCVACGTAENLSLDHIIPFSQGGPDTVDNLRTLCRRCNARRGAARITDQQLKELA